MSDLAVTASSLVKVYEPTPGWMRLFVRSPNESP